MREPADFIEKHACLLLFLLLIGLLGYLLPWAVAPSAPMTLNAYDLAEWTSLHPAQRHSSPPLLAPLLLRAQLVILSLTFALVVSRRPWRLISAATVAILALAQLPPFEYVYDIANLNYRQQFGLALASLIAGLVATRVESRRIIQLLLMLLPVVGICAVYVGLSQALDVYRQTQTVVGIGLGPWLLTASLCRHRRHGFAGDQVGRATGYKLIYLALLPSASATIVSCPT